MKADAMTEAAVKAVLDKLAGAYNKRDMSLFLSICSQEPDLIMYGTGADEKRIGLAEFQEQVERDWSQTEAATFAYDWTSISAAGSVAWVATDVSMHLKAGGQEMSFPMRGTLVLEKRGEKWLLMQIHFSLPAIGQDEGESWPTQ